MVKINLGFLVIVLALSYYLFTNPYSDFFKMGCEKGSARNCHLLGIMYYYGHEDIVKDKQQAVNLYLQACEGNVELACNDLGLFYSEDDEINRDNKKALKFYSKACSLGLKESCESFESLSDFK